MLPINPSGKEINWNFFCSFFATLKLCSHMKLGSARDSINHLSFPFRRAFKRQCTEDGTWLEGSCEPVTCDPPPPIFHGSYNCTNGFRFDSTCTLNCSDPAGNTAIAGTGRSAHTVRLLHPTCKQICPSLSSLSILALPVSLSSLFYLFFAPSQFFFVLFVQHNLVINNIITDKYSAFKTICTTRLILQDYW